MENFDVKDHGIREEMKTGSVRDTQKGKPRFDLIPPTCLTKLAMHYGAGSDKYGDRNWEKGQSITRYISSAERHFQYFKMGLTDENHLMACVWNLFCIDWTLDKIRIGALPKELDDRTEDMKCSKTCSELFEKIEKNIKEKNSVTNSSNKEESGKHKGFPENILESIKEPINNFFKTETILTETKNINKSEIINIGNAFSFSHGDECFFVMDENGYFLNKPDKYGNKYTNKMNSFNIYNEKSVYVFVSRELRNNIKNMKKFIIIPESVSMFCLCEYGLSIYGYDEKTESLEYVMRVKNIFKMTKHEKDVIKKSKYINFTVDFNKN